MQHGGWKLNIVHMYMLYFVAVDKKIGTTSSILCSILHSYNHVCT